MILSQNPRPIEVSFGEGGSLTGPLSGEDDRYSEPSGAMLEKHLSPLMGFGESSGDRPFDIEVHLGSPVLGTPQRDEDVMP